ncbi:MAG: helix-turn-helix domain-containing protein [Dehalococcoidia bacterium]|nr:helix-turn-helix domain-containing protein [Dehalococcoidia bacterium]
MTTNAAHLAAGASAPPPRIAAVLTETQVANLLAMKVATLRAWRLNGRGPAYMKFGRAVRYRREDVEAFVERSRVPREQLQ